MALTVLLRQVIHGVEGGRSAPSSLCGLSDSLREILSALCARSSAPSARDPPLSPRAILVGRKLSQQRSDADETPVQNTPRNPQQLPQFRVRHPVDHCRALLAADDNSTLSKARELLRHDRLIEGKRLLQVLHPDIAIHEDF